MASHQLQLLLLLLLDSGQVLGELRAPVLLLQPPLDLQDLPGDAAEGQRDLMHQLSVAQEVVVRPAAQVRLVPSASRGGGDNSQMQARSPPQWQKSPRFLGEPSTALQSKRQDAGGRRRCNKLGSNLSSATTSLCNPGHLP